MCQQGVSHRFLHEIHFCAGQDFQLIQMNPHKFYSFSTEKVQTFLKRLRIIDKDSSFLRLYVLSLAIELSFCNEVQRYTKVLVMVASTHRVFQL